MKNLELYEYYGPKGGDTGMEERIELLMEAQEKLGEVVNLIETALRGTTYESHARAYIVGHLNGWIDTPDRFNMGIQQYIDKLSEEEEEEYDEEED